jgi:hypothetical protein
MKKIVLLIAILYLVYALQAQVSIGLTAGANIGTFKQDLNYDDLFDGSYENDISPVAGLIFGIPVDITLGGKIDLLITPSYYQKGARAKSLMESPEYFRSDTKSRIRYLECPVQLKFYIIKKKINVYGLFGPSFGLGLGARSKYEIWLEYDGEEVREEYDEKYSAGELKDSGVNQFDFSLTLGAGISKKLGSGDLYFQTSYVYGLTNMIDEEVGIDLDIKQYTRGINIMAGYLIPLSAFSW